MTHRVMGSALALSAAVGPCAAQQAFVQPTVATVGWDRFAPDSAYLAWDFFFVASGGNSPDLGRYPNPLPTGWQPDVVETSGFGFVTATGNIYGLAGPTDFEVTIPSYGLGEGMTRVLVQLKTLGTELDYDSVRLDGKAPAEVRELYRFHLGPPQQGGGDDVETLFRFDLAGNASEYTLTFNAAEASMSLDIVAVDTWVAACPADLTGDGRVDTNDFFAFLSIYQAGDPLADFTGDGEVDTNDFFAFLGAYQQGC